LRSPITVGVHRITGTLATAAASQSARSVVANTSRVVPWSRCQTSLMPIWITAAAGWSAASTAANGACEVP
jgi:hypothetical protein